MTQQLTEASLRDWMQRLGPRLIAISAGICRDRHRAEEIVQEAFIKLWRNPPDGGEPAYSSWLRRVVTNLSINTLKRTRRPGALPEFSTDRAMQSGEEAGQALGRSETVDRVRAAMDRLDEPKRAILVLRGCEQLSYDEIAVHLGVPIGTVMSRLNRARAALMDELKKDLPASDGDEPQVFDFQKYKQA
jgi:RNA polymerase sigma-70 factor (ECF subfamily)